MYNLLKNHEIRLHNTRNLLKERGLSRADFADKIGMTYTLLSQYIGKNPTKKIGDDTVRKIENSFNLPSGYLDQPVYNREFATKDSHENLITNPEIQSLLDSLMILDSQKKLTPDLIKTLHSVINLVEST